MNLNPVLDEITERTVARGEVNVATMTIVVFFEDEKVGELARDRIRTLAGKHPSRVIVFDATRDQSLQTVETPDWIELGAAQSAAEMLRYATDALRLPDTPVVLLWIASGIGEDARFTVLAHDVQTIVCNSSLIDLGIGAMCEFIDYAKEHPELPLSDISYMRLAPWQESVATFFDSKDARDDLFDLRRVEIECGSEPEAYYLLGWLASRLEWTPCGPAEMCNRFGTMIDFEITRGGEPRRIRKITLSSSQSQFAAQVDPNNHETILLNVTGLKSHPDRYSPINNTGIAALVERAILWGRNDQVFHDSLVAAGEILSRRKD
jgi:glucose-6-phosphate dehydrogenase assembly protein OpcA